MSNQKKNLPESTVPIVQKSRPLFSLWKSSLTLSEFKILDTYLARINSHKPQNRTVVLEKGELESLLGIKKINLSDLRKRLDHLVFPVHIDDPDIPGGFQTITLFQKIKYVPDLNGIWTITMECTPEAMKYIFNVENLGYLRYKLRSIMPLASRYSYILFLYIEQNRFQTTWTVSVSELRSILCCENTSTYDEFRRFNDKILKRAQSEIVEKTECRFSYQPVRTGSKVHEIVFSVDPLPEIQDASCDVVEDQEEDLKMSPVEFLRHACMLPNGEPEFSLAETRHLKELIRAVPSSRIPGHRPGNVLIAMYNYLSERYASMNRIAEKHPIKNRFAYLAKMLQTDAGLD